MVCYIVPLIALVAIFFMRNSSYYKNNNLGLLSTLLVGGGVMLIIDHAWNNELFFVGPNVGADLVLGGIMTGGVFVVWALSVRLGRTRARAFTKEVN